MLLEIGPPSLAKACKQLKNKQIKISLVRNIFILIYIDLTKNIYFATKAVVVDSLLKIVLHLLHMNIQEGTSNFTAIR